MQTAEQAHTLHIPRSLILVLVALGTVLTFTVVPGVFSVDENNYLETALGLRKGRLTVPGTEHLSPSRELFSFDPEANRRVAQSTPVVSLAPPLYSISAAPFTFLGWRGLVLLNTIAFLVAALLVFLYAQRYARQPMTPWLALALFVLGGYSLEYAQGVWPHMLAVALCTGAVFLASEVRRSGLFWAALASGVLVGIAAGVREQNIFFGACVGFGILLWAPKRWLTSASYAAGVGIPLLVSASLNYAKLGLWNPLPKANVYVAEVSGKVGPAALSVLEGLRVFWAKVVDYSTYPPIPDPVKALLVHRSDVSGAILVEGVLKKAWIQSSPWIALALVVLAVAWFVRRGPSAAIRREAKALSLIIFPTLFMFTLAGFGRVDGWAYNQRYFLELVPLVAVGLALSLDGTEMKSLHAFGGFIAGVIVALVVLALPGIDARHFAILYTPLVMAAALVAAWMFRRTPGGRTLLALILGLCIGWSFFLHVGDDLRASRHKRWVNSVRCDALDRILPDYSALVAYWGFKDAAGPLRLHKDVVILDAWADQGQDAPKLIGELLAQGRRVFVLEDGFPRPLLEKIMYQRPVRPVPERDVRVVEVLE